MLFSLAIIFLLGMTLGKLFDLLKLPKLIGLLLTGVILGPNLMNILDPKILLISSDLRQLALIIILIRAGLNLDLKDLRSVGVSALLISFLPALFEILGVIIFAPMIFNISVLDAALLGSVLAAVSPAIIVPRMLKLKELRLGTAKMIPHLIMAGSSMDDVFVIVIFTSLLTFSTSQGISSLSWITLPSSLILGITTGVVVGLGLSWWFTRFHIRDTGKVIIILSSAFLLLTLEHINTTHFGFSALLAVMMMGATIQIRKEHVAQRLSFKFSKLWLASEVLLFVLVGALVSLESMFSLSMGAFLLLIFSLLFRSLGVLLSIIKTNFNHKEKLFTVMSYLPKATVQAAIGGIPLAMNHPQGELILSMAVISIVITAPLGAYLIDHYHQRLLNH